MGNSVELFSRCFLCKHLARFRLKFFLESHVLIQFPCSHCCQCGFFSFPYFTVAVVYIHIWNQTKNSKSHIEDYTLIYISSCCKVNWNRLRFKIQLIFSRFCTMQVYKWHEHLSFKSHLFQHKKTLHSFKFDKKKNNVS